MADTKFDLIVIGAGPGGYVAAIRAAQLGLRTACVDDRDRLGGTCLNIGCIPSKALLQSSEKYHEACHGLAVHGIAPRGVDLDLAAMMGRKNEVVKSLTGGVAGLFRKNDVTHVRGRARLAGGGRVKVAGDDGERRRIDVEEGLVRRRCGFPAADPLPLPIRTIEESHLPPRRLSECRRRIVGVPDPDGPVRSLPRPQRCTLVRRVHGVPARHLSAIPEVRTARQEQRRVARDQDPVRRLALAP